MEKVLAGFIGNGKAGGVDRYLLNFWEEVSSDDIRIDFLTNEIDNELQRELKSRKSRIFAVADLKHPVRQYRQIRKILRQGNYDVVYFNISTAIECIAVIAAKHENVKKRILHSHSSGNNCETLLKRSVYNFIHSFCRLLLYRYATQYCGCSKKAGEWLFPKKIVESDRFEVIYNAVERKRFEYQAEVREEVRAELCLKDSLTVGNIANFCYQKNHVFLLKIFAEVLKQRPDAILVLVGNGVQYDKIRQKVKEMHMESSVRFLGGRGDVHRIYQAMDVFVLPSRFEGLPIVGVEAQFSGLPCIMSGEITREAAITKRCHFLGLEEDVSTWADMIIRSAGERTEAKFLQKAENYDLDRQKEQLKALI